MLDQYTHLLNVTFVKMQKMKADINEVLKFDVQQEREKLDKQKKQY